MLQLASLGDGGEAEYEQRLANDELRHPLLVSLRRIQSKQQQHEAETDATDSSQTQSSQTQTSSEMLSAVVMEAAPCTFTEIPNDSIEAIHGLLAGSADISERLAVVPLDRLKYSHFYNMLADDKPVEKALVLLRFAQRGNGKQNASGFRIVTDRTSDATANAATELTKENCYVTVALCTVEKSPDFQTVKDSIAMAVISKVDSPLKPLQHAADLYIEAMEIVPKDDLANCINMMQQMQRFSNARSSDPTTSNEIAWQQRKCRRLQRYPTQAEVPAEDNSPATEL